MMGLSPGDRLRLADGTTVEVVENPRDGAWVVCRSTADPKDKSVVFWMDVVAVAD